MAKIERIEIIGSEVLVYMDEERSSGHKDPKTAV